MWTYSQYAGTMSDPDGNLLATGYAGGDRGAHPEAVNNPAYQDQHDIGPLPQGKYAMGDAVDNPQTGPLSIPLTPDPANEMFGRSGFYIHGDLIGHVGERMASDGCIVLEHDARVAMSVSADRELLVVG